MTTKTKRLTKTLVNDSIEILESRIRDITSSLTSVDELKQQYQDVFGAPTSANEMDHLRLVRSLIMNAVFKMSRRLGLEKGE